MSPICGYLLPKYYRNIQVPRNPPYGDRPLFAFQKKKTKKFSSHCRSSESKTVTSAKPNKPAVPNHLQKLSAKPLGQQEETVSIRKIETPKIITISHHIYSAIK